MDCTWPRCGVWLLRAGAQIGRRAGGAGSEGAFWPLCAPSRRRWYLHYARAPLLAHQPPWGPRHSGQWETGEGAGLTQRAEPTEVRALRHTSTRPGHTEDIAEHESPRADAGHCGGAGPSKTRTPQAIRGNRGTSVASVLGSVPFSPLPPPLLTLVEGPHCHVPL